ncbi:hypothetical protein ABFS83_14G293300 [Erythranthe nasuta]
MYTLKCMYTLNEETKLILRISKCIILGYFSHRKMYKCYSPVIEKFYNSMDVSFFGEHSTLYILQILVGYVSILGETRLKKEKINSLFPNSDDISRGNTSFESTSTDVLNETLRIIITQEMKYTHPRPRNHTFRLYRSQKYYSLSLSQAA